MGARPNQVRLQGQGSERLSMARGRPALLNDTSAFFLYWVA